MALNFPLNPADGSIHEDPVSGLKYIFNSSIGGWETAIQPPCIVTADTNAPDIDLDGFLWYDTSTRILSVKRGGTWAAIGGSDEGNKTNVTVSDTPPINNAQGDLWWDEISGNLFIWYIDGTSNQWVIAAPNVGGESKSSVFVGPNAPADPVVGTVWYNTIDNVLYVFTGGNPGWESATSPVQGVDKVLGASPIFVTEDIVNDSVTPTVHIETASSTQMGAMRYATGPEVASINPVVAALTPASLAANIDPYLPAATTERAGVIEIATDEEAVLGQDLTKAITPHTLKLAANSAGNPPGTIIAFAGPNPPSGYLVCNGGEIKGPISGYMTKIANGRIIDEETIDPGQYYLNLATLYDIVGTYYSFNGTAHMVPDLRGEFVRGYDDGRGIDSGRVMGSYQKQSVQSHVHQGPAGDPDVDKVASLKGGADRNGNNAIYETSASGAEGTDGSDATFKAGVVETRPRNVSLLYCIKY